MFTGIVRAIGRIEAVSGESPRRLSIATGVLPTAGMCAGDSVAVSGVCLTVVTVGDRVFESELSGETVARTTLGGLGAGVRVNLEPALRAADALGGHFVTGHVDGVARTSRVAESGGSLHAWLSAPPGLARFLAPKGSVTLDGVSLTVGAVDGPRFSIDLVPHTRGATTLGELQPGQMLNLEVDVVARYLDRLLTARDRP